MRYHAYRLATGTWLTRDLPMIDGIVTRELSGPGGLELSMSPEIGPILGDDGMRLVDIWSTAIIAEDETNDEIIQAGIVTDVDISEDDQTAKVTCAGLTTYAHGVPYLDRVQFGRVDPMIVVRHIWSYLQAFPSMTLPLTIDPNRSSDVIIGTVQEPYNLNWWETTDLGAEIDNLAGDTPFDYLENYAWSSDEGSEKDAWGCFVRLGYPRLGKRRDKLRFVEGENIIEAVSVGISGADFANEIQGYGRGEGRTALQSNAALIDGRLRRPKVLTDKLAGQQRLDRLVNRWLRRMNATADGDVSEVIVRDHVNARLSDIQPGDDIHIECYVPWLGDFDEWVRVLQIERADSEPEVARLSVARSSSFIYSAELSIDTGETS